MNIFNGGLAVALAVFFFHHRSQLNNMSMNVWTDNFFMCLFAGITIKNYNRWNFLRKSRPLNVMSKLVLLCDDDDSIFWIFSAIKIYFECKSSRFWHFKFSISQDFCTFIRLRKRLFTILCFYDNFNSKLKPVQYDTNKPVSPFKHSMV